MRKGLWNANGREIRNKKERGEIRYRNIAGRRKRVNLKEAVQALTVCEGQLQSLGEAQV